MARSGTGQGPRKRRAHLGGGSINGLEGMPGPVARDASRRYG